MSTTSWKEDQQGYLESAQTLGARVCDALGWRAAMWFVDECVGKEKPLNRGALLLLGLQCFYAG